MGGDFAQAESGRHFPYSLGAADLSSTAAMAAAGELSCEASKPAAFPLLAHGTVGLLYGNQYGTVSC